MSEVTDGGSNAVSVTTVVHQPGPIAAGQEATADITNTYDFVPGSLTVTKTIFGTGAGQQGAVTITVTCESGNTPTTLLPLFVIPPGATGAHSYTYDDIPAGSTCTVLEDPDGSHSNLAVVKSGSGVVVTIHPGETATAALTDTYETGSLVVNKTITGPAAGFQGQVVISVSCVEAGVTTALPDFVIHAAVSPGTLSRTYPNIPAGSPCTVTETEDGTPGVTGTLHVVTEGSPQTVTISPDGTATANLTDTYTYTTGSLRVTKTINGPASGHQGQVTISVSCDDSPLPDFVIMPGFSRTSMTYPDIPAGSVCKVIETEDGSTGSVNVSITGGSQVITVPAGFGVTASADITDTYTFADGSLVVNKTVGGSAAGQQGEIVIEISCDGNRLEDFVIPAGTTEPQSKDYTDLPAGSRCSVVETADGSTGNVAVAKEGSGTEVTIPAGAEKTVDLTDTYESGALVVNKTITGSAAGSQGEVRIAVSCDEAGAQTSQPDFVIPAGTAAGTVSMSYPNILAGSTCTLTETATGATETATAMTMGIPQEVTISENGTATANVVNTYDYVPGALVVTKDIAGPAAGQQGQVSIGVSCVLGGAQTTLDPFVIPAGQAAGIVSHTYQGIPAGSTCTVAETEDGSTSTVSVQTVGGNQALAVPARDEVVANITDTYYVATPVRGALTVTKTITGPAAGQQGAITIAVSCNGTALSDFVIPAGTPASTVSRSYAGIADGSTCIATETGNGASPTVLAVTEGSPQTVDLSGNGTGVANITDTYSNVAIPLGSLTVTKNITGPAAGQQGPITVTASCNGRALSPTLNIPAGATGVQSQTYPGIPAGSVCSATAGPDGSTSTVQVTITGDGHTVSIPAGGVVTAALTDTYTSLPGSLLVTKTITGPAGGQQGAVTMQAVCAGAPLSPELSLPAGAAAGTYSQTYEDIPAGSTCTVHETANGSTSTVSVTTTGAGQTVTVPAAHVAEAGITDTYGLTAGSLLVTKTITGPAAGQQGTVTVQAVCDGSPLSPALKVPGGAAAGTYSHTYDGVTAGSTCQVTETADGSNQSVAVKVTGDGQHVTVLRGFDSHRGPFRHLFARGGLTACQQNYRRPRRGVSGPGQYPGCLRRRHPHAGVHSPGRSSRGHHLSHLRRRPGRFDVHRERAHRRGDQRRLRHHSGHHPARHRASR